MANDNSSWVYPDPSTLEELIQEVDKYLELLYKKDRVPDPAEIAWVHNHPLRQSLAGGPIGSIERARSLRSYLANLLPSFQAAQSDEAARRVEAMGMTKPEPDREPFSEKDTDDEGPAQQVVWINDLALEIHAQGSFNSCSCGIPTPANVAFAKYLVVEKGWRPPAAPRTVQLNEGPIFETDDLMEILDRPELKKKLPEQPEGKLRPPRADRIYPLPSDEPKISPSIEMVAKAIETAAEVLTKESSTRAGKSQHTITQRLFAADIIVRASQS